MYNTIQYNINLKVVLYKSLAGLVELKKLAIRKNRSKHKYVQKRLYKNCKK